MRRREYGAAGWLSGVEEGSTSGGAQRRRHRGGSAWEARAPITRIGGAHGALGGCGGGHHLRRRHGELQAATSCFLLAGGGSRFDDGNLDPMLR
jgi:hypothetical protein